MNGRNPSLVKGKSDGDTGQSEHKHAKDTAFAGSNPAARTRAWNCGFKGDFPAEFEFCMEECPRYKHCEQIQDLRYPLEAWRLVAVTYQNGKEKASL